MINVFSLFSKILELSKNSITLILTISNMIKIFFKMQNNLLRFVVHHTSYTGTSVRKIRVIQFICVFTYRYKLEQTTEFDKSLRLYYITNSDCDIRINVASWSHYSSILLFNCKLCRIWEFSASSTIIYLLRCVCVCMYVCRYEKETPLLKFRTGINSF